MAVTKRFSVLLAGLILLLYSCSNKPSGRFVDERYTLGAADKKPFGGHVASFMMDTIFGTSRIEEVSKPFNQWYDDFLDQSERSNHVYVIIAPTVRAFDKEASDMQRFVARGNTLLVVTDEISEAFAKQFHCKLIDEADNLSRFLRLQMLDTKVSIADSSAHAMLSYQYYYYPLMARLTVDSTATDSLQWLGRNNGGQPHIARYTVGEGQLILATNARALSNYFLLSQQNFGYFKALLSYLPAYPNLIHRDLFFQRNINRQPEDYSVFQALMAIPPLRWSFWILLVLAAIWVLSNLRRKQKMIPVVSPNTNTTVSFIQTIAQLYFNRQDHANVGRKMATHFTDYLRSNYYMPPLAMQNEWAYILHQKTGMPIAEATETTRLIRKAQQSNDFTATDLLQLHQLIADVMNRKKTHRQQQ